jgi:hypothetical protein
VPATAWIARRNVRQADRRHPLSVGAPSRATPPLTFLLPSSALLALLPSFFSFPAHTEQREVVVLSDLATLIAKGVEGRHEVPCPHCVVFSSLIEAIWFVMVTVSP